MSEASKCSVTGRTGRPIAGDGFTGQTILTAARAHLKLIETHSTAFNKHIKNIP